MRVNLLDTVTSIAGFDLTGDSGVRAAAYAAPVWLFAREEINGHDPCYPEGATNAKGNSTPPGQFDIISLHLQCLSHFHSLH